MFNRVDKGKQPMHPYQSLWMSQWPTLQEQNQVSALLGDHGNDHVTNQWHLQKHKEITSDISGSATKQRSEIKAIDFGIIKGNQAVSSRNQRKDRPELLDSSLVNLSQESQHTPNVEHVTPLLSLAPPETETSYMDSHIQYKSVSQCPIELMKSQKILGSSLAFSAPLPENFSGTSSRVSPQIIDLKEGRCESGSIPTAPSFVCSVEENVNHVRSTQSSKRKLSDTNIMKVMEREKCSDGSGLLADNLFMRNNHPPAFREEQYKEMNNCSSINLFSTYAHDANTMLTYASPQDLVGCTPRYQENRTFLVRENTDSSLRKKKQNLRDSRVLTRVQENVPIKCYSFTQLIGHGKQEVQIQVLSSSDSEGKDDVYDVNATEVVSKNASSVETHTMDMNMIKEKHLSGVESSSSKKNVNANTDLPHLDLTIGTPGEKVQPRKRPIPAIPDMNIQLRAEPGEASVVDNAEPSTSRLDMDYAPDSSSRWLKRLKISDPCNHSVGKKSLRLDEATSNKKANEFVSEGMRGESSNSEPVPVSTGKEPMIVNQKTTALKTVVSRSNDNLDGSDGTKRLHSWIQRWQKTPAETSKNTSEPVVICDPQSSKVSLEELEKKPLSSIAAMALLGKGWSGLKCHYQNKGSFTVWES